MCTLMQLETLSSISKIDERIASKKSAKLNFTNLSPTSLMCLISKIKDDLKKYGFCSNYMRVQFRDYMKIEIQNNNRCCLKQVYRSLGQALGEAKVE